MARKTKTDKVKLETNKRYMEKLEQMVVRVHSDGSDGVLSQDIKAAAAQAGESLNAYILQAIRDRMDRDRAQGATVPGRGDKKTATPPKD